MPTVVESSSKLTTDCALREVIEVAFNTNARLNREHEVEIRNAKRTEQEALDRATRLQDELREAEAALEKVRKDLEDSLVERIAMAEELTAVRDRVTGAEQDLEAAVTRAKDLEREVDSMCEVFQSESSNVL